MPGYQITASAELMENYLHVDALAPQRKSIALQSRNGDGLLFSISSEGDLGVAIEAAGVQHGWTRRDLATHHVTARFGDAGVVKTFAASQTIASALDSGVIHLAMVVHDGVQDHLLLSLGNSDHDLTWTQSPKWAAAPSPLPPPPTRPAAHTTKPCVWMLLQVAKDARAYCDAFQLGRLPLSVPSTFH